MLKLKMFEEKDAEALCALFKDREVYELTCAEKYGKYPLKADDFLSYYKNPAVFPFTPVYNGEGAGHIIIENCGDRFHIGSVVIKKEFRGLGLGKETFCAAVLKAKEMGAGCVTIGVFEENAPALSLYLSQGFSVYDESERLLKGVARPYLLLKKDF